MTLDPFHTEKNGIFETTYCSDENGDLVVVKKMNRKRIFDTIEANKQEADAYRPHDGNDFRHVAEIPLDVAEIWAAERGVNMHTDEGMAFFVNNFLSDPDYKYLKTVPSNYRIKKME